LSLLQNSNAISTGGAYNLESSLRFRSSASAYLTRTLSASGTTNTWSFWVKRGKLSSGYQSLFDWSNGVNTSFGIVFTSSDTLDFYNYSSAYTMQLVTTQLFRDPSAWYHIVVVMDTTNATASDRARIYVNGNRVTTFSTATYPTQNLSLNIATSRAFDIGALGTTHIQNFDGYMTEFNFVDGQALTPSDFGETDTTTGVWKPKEYTGTYGTNGFYLPMKETQQATGFNTVLYTGNGGEQTIDKVGFSPDLVWLKNRGTTNSHYLTDSVRGNEKSLNSNATNAEFDYASYGGLSLVSNGFHVETGTSNVFNTNGNNFVAWCWDAGSSTVSNTDGTITSSVRANPATGFSIVTYTGNGSSGTVGHGLGSAPEMIIIKNRSQADGWYVWHQNNGAGIYGYLFLNSTDQVRSSTPQFGTTAPDSSVISLTYNTNDWANASGENYVAYCFSEVAGYSKFGSYTGNGSASGPTVTTGFRPAFLMIKNATTGSTHWFMYDNTRDTDNVLDNKLLASLNEAEGSNALFNVNITDTGFQPAANYAGINSSGDTYIYMAFADTRDAQFNFDASGNKNNWTANNINSNASSESTYDIMNDVATLTDEDTANFCTLNPLDKNTNVTLSNGNLTYTAGASWYSCRSTFGMASDSWYAELTHSGANTMIGVMSSSATLSNHIGVGGYGYFSDGSKYSGGTGSAYGGAWSTGDIIGIAFNADTGDLTFYKNGVSQGVAFTGLTTTLYFIGMSVYNGSSNINFGQRPFKYTPPTGYKKLNTYNLPDSTIKDGSQYFNTVLYTGNDTTQSITGVGFQPDFVWIKARNTGVLSHGLFDAVRGVNRTLFSDVTSSELTNVVFTSFDSDGFSVSDAGGNWTNDSYNYAAWNWRGSDSSPVSNTDGTITSTVSANTDSGFSVVTYTANGTAGATVGHGLGVAPSMIIIKDRSATFDWSVYHSGIGNTKYIFLNRTDASATSATFWNNTSPTNNVFTLGSTGFVNNNGSNLVAYCFADVEGFSKFGSYTGNNSADGPFVYTGFRPAFIMFKRTDSAQNWFIFDNTRSPYNTIDEELRPNTSAAEVTGSTNVDYLSNGFKIYYSGTAGINQAGNYIYMAFAENPFKQSLAR
jgi:hypothetical protein